MVSTVYKLQAMKPVLIFIGLILFCCSCKVADLRSVSTSNHTINYMFPEFKEQTPSLAAIEKKFGTGNNQASPYVYSWYIQKHQTYRTARGYKKGKKELGGFDYKRSEHPAMAKPNYLHNYEKNTKIRPAYELLVRTDDNDKIIEMSLLCLY